MNGCDVFGVTQMELGGKDAAIICEDADLDLAAKHIVKGAFSYSGQRCTAVKVVGHGGGVGAGSGTVSILHLLVGWGRHMHGPFCRVFCTDFWVS